MDNDATDSPQSPVARHITATQVVDPIMVEIPYKEYNTHSNTGNLYLSVIAFARTLCDIDTNREPTTKVKNLTKDARIPTQK